MAEHWLVKAVRAEAGIFYQDLISSGCEETIASNLTTVAYGLLKGNSTLWTRADQDDVLKVTLGASGDMPSILQHDDRLLPYWNRLVEALSSVTFSGSRRTCITFSITQMQLSKEVMDMLLQSLKKPPLIRIYLCNNGLGEDGYKWLIELLSTNTSLKSLYIESNPIESEAVTKLANAVIDHPNMDNIMLDKCEIGQKDTVLKAVLPLLCLKEVYLESNHIGSYGAELISDSLATNPTIQRLNLRDNLLNDADAKKLSDSLKTNTNLQVLSLAGNLITRDGMTYLFLSLYDITSFNTISDSNHICFIKFTDKEDVFKLNEVNKYTDPVFNKNLKIFKSLMRDDQRKNGLSYLKDTPIEVMPRLLALLDNTAMYRLNALFRFMKEWSMPLLYTSRLGEEPRRSNRIRKKMVMKSMGKK